MFAAAALVCPPRAGAQITASNLLEARVGRDPDAARFVPPEFQPSASRFSLFEQLSLDWTHEALRLGFRYETYVPSEDSTLEYHTFVRRYATWTGRHFDAAVGNYEAIFGRGLVLRAFELPGVIREEFATPQFGDLRDLDGVRARFHSGRWEAEALQGKPRLANQPPEEPRRGSVEGATATVRFLEAARAGGNYLRLDAQASGPGSRLETGGGFLAVGFDRWFEQAGLGWLSLDSYAEYDRATGLDLPAVISSPRAPLGEGYGIYIAQSLGVSEPLPGWRLGASWEFKDYQNFELAVNEPPTLVREHSFPLLNRSTHVLEAGQERGTQFETSLDWRDRVDVVFNLSGAEARRSARFDERYLELSGHWRDHTLTLFADDAADATEIPAVLDRDTGGGFLRLQLRPNQALELDLEMQRRDVRAFGGAPGRIEDRYGSLAWMWNQHFSLAVVRQSTDDPQEATDPTTGALSRRYYDSLQGTLGLFANHELILFWGRRRGGLACTGGTCYKVQAFDGVSARLASRF